MTVTTASADRLAERGEFLVRTYLHLLAAVLVFVALESWYFQTSIADRLAEALGSVPWLAVLGAWMIVAWLAVRLAHRAHSLPAQYAALALYVVGKSLIFVPLISRAERAAPGALESAALATLVGFASLTAVVFVTRRDFSFLGAFLRWAFLGALLLIVGALLFSFRLGAWFSVAMVLLAGAAVLSDTSKVLHRYRGQRSVAAALELFSSIALMLWYLLRLFGSRR